RPKPSGRAIPIQKPTKRNGSKTIWDPRRGKPEPSCWRSLNLRQPRGEIRDPRAAPSLFRVSMGEPMNRKRVGIALAALFGASAFATPSLAQNEQFIPQLVYRTGAYAPNRAPLANGVADYYKLINERDGGINGVKIAFEECDTGYATDRGVECYERLKGKGPTGAAYVFPLSTGISFALTEKAPLDKIPLITMGYGR